MQFRKMDKIIITDMNAAGGDDVLDCGSLDKRPVVVKFSDRKAHLEAALRLGRTKVGSGRQKMGYRRTLQPKGMEWVMSCMEEDEYDCGVDESAPVNRAADNRVSLRRELRDINSHFARLRIKAAGREPGPAAKPKTGSNSDAAAASRTRSAARREPKQRKRAKADNVGLVGVEMNPGPAHKRRSDGEAKSKSPVSEGADKTRRRKSARPQAKRPARVSEADKRRPHASPAVSKHGALEREAHQDFKSAQRDADAQVRGVHGHCPKEYRKLKDDLFHLARSKKSAEGWQEAIRALAELAAKFSERSVLEHVPVQDVVDEATAAIDALVSDGVDTASVQSPPLAELPAQPTRGRKDFTINYALLQDSSRHFLRQLVNWEFFHTTKVHCLSAGAAEAGGVLDLLSNIAAVYRLEPGQGEAELEATWLSDDAAEQLWVLKTALKQHVDYVALWTWDYQDLWAWHEVAQDAVVSVCGALEDLAGNCVYEGDRVVWGPSEADPLPAEGSPGKPPPPPLNAGAMVLEPIVFYYNLALDTFHREMDPEAVLRAKLRVMLKFPLGVVLPPYGWYLFYKTYLNARKAVWRKFTYTVDPESASNHSWSYNADRGTWTWEGPTDWGAAVQHLERRVDHQRSPAVTGSMRTGYTVETVDLNCFGNPVPSAVVCSRGKDVRDVRRVCHDNLLVNSWLTHTPSAADYSRAYQMMSREEKIHRGAIEVDAVRHTLQFMQGMIVHKHLLFENGASVDRELLFGSEPTLFCPARLPRPADKSRFT